MNGEMTGYNFKEMGDLFREVDEIANDTTKEIQDCIDTKILDPLSEMWVAPEAKKFAESFNTVVVESGDAVAEAFNQFIANIDAAQNAWSEKTGGGSTAKNAPTVKCKLSVDTGKFKEQDGDGNIFLKKTAATNFAEGELPAIEKALMTAIEEKKGNLTKAVTSFLGEGQGEAVNTCFGAVLTAIGSIFEYLSTGDKSLAKSITEAAETYTQMAKSVTDGMGQQGK